MRNYQRVILGFGIIISFFLGFGLFTLSTIQKLSHFTSTIYNHPLVVSNASLQANALITKMHRNMKDVVLFDSLSDVERFVKAVNEEEINVYKHLDIVKSKILGEKGKQLEKKARIQFTKWRSIRSEVIDLVKKGDRIKAAAITVGKGANHVELLEKNMLGLTGYARKRATDFMAQKDYEYKKARSILILFLISSIAASFVISFITLRQNKKAERLLKSSEQRYRSLIETQTDLVSRFTPEGKFTFVNDVFCRFFNKTKQEVLGGTWQPLPVEEDLPHIQAQLATLSTENSTVIIENRIYSGSGDIHWMQFVNMAFFDSAGKMTEIQSVGRDITEQKLHEKRINYQNLILDSINRVFLETMNCNSVSDVAKICLNIAQEITNSKFGSIAEVNKDGRFDTIALSNPGWDKCEFIESDHDYIIQDMEIRGIWGSALESKNGKIFNSPGKHPDSVGTPEGHPPLNSFIGVPFKHNIVKGVIGLANKKGAYTEDDKLLLQALSFSFAETIERKRAELALIGSEERYRTLFKLSSDAIFLVDVETLNLLDANEAAINLYGFSYKEIKNMKATDISAEKNKTLKAIQKSHDTAVPIRYHKKKDGTVFPVEITANVFTLGAKEINISSIRDITDRIEYETKIKLSLQEKEVLLKEVHHRVKNNMQVIQSLLSLQLNTLEKPDQKKPLIDSGNRIKSMALIHETLYRSQDIAQLDITSYFDSIVQHLFKIYNTSNIQVVIQVDIGPGDVDMDGCIACGLIINELVSNALKYAFADNKKGKLSIFLKRVEENQVNLVVEDDGSGLPAGFEIEASESLGLKIVKILTQGQLNGHLNVTFEAGTVFDIKFPLST